MPRLPWGRGWRWGGPLAVAIILGMASASAAGAAGFADPSFAARWTTTDEAVAGHAVARSWLWGPAPIARATEAYDASPGGQRLVQYFDKARMEITYPDTPRASPWYVTNGMLVVELVTGRMQKGYEAVEPRPPATLPVAGDLDDSGAPTYSSLAPLVSFAGVDKSAPRLGATVIETIDDSGQVGSDPGLAAAGVHLSAYSDETGHNLPDVLIDWLQAGPLGDTWVNATGYPIAEPYWAAVHVEGRPARVLVQLFERRVLTYNPGNPAGWQVEMGNVGWHYYLWRYGG